ncbi:MAG: HU family DNA-binding protein [Muribaculaceae bacterium]|nr:HU family DNA-binding protein [Muribaculaceae bacterium]
MNHKIPLHDLAEIIAAKSGASHDEAERFAKVLFETVTDILVNGDNVKIKGLGSFSVTNDPENPVEFIPDRDLADTVNAPFALFEPEIITDDVTEEELRAASASTEPDKKEVVEGSLEHEPTPEPEPEPKPVIEEPVKVVETIVEPEPAEPLTETVKIEPKPEPKPEPEVKPASVKPQTPQTLNPVNIRRVIDEDEEEYVTEPEKKGLGFGWGFMVGLLVGIALGACAIYFALDYLYPTSPRVELEESVEITNDILSENPVVAEPVDSTQEEVVTDTASTATVQAETQTAVAASVAPEPTPESKPEPKAAPAEIKKDTVRAGYLLVNMAKKYYGDKVFWVYIYEENKAKIKNPNQVGAGTVVVIPPASKYGIDAKSEASINKAKQKASQILSKYPK